MKCELLLTLETYLKQNADFNRVLQTKKTTTSTYPLTKKLHCL